MNVLDSSVQWFHMNTTYYITQLLPVYLLLAIILFMWQICFIQNWCTHFNPVHSKPFFNVIDMLQESPVSSYYGRYSAFTLKEMSVVVKTKQCNKGKPAFPLNWQKWNASHHERYLSFAQLQASPSSSPNLWSFWKATVYPRGGFVYVCEIKVDCCQCWQLFMLCG